MKMIIVVISGEKTWEGGRERSGAGGWGGAGWRRAQNSLFYILRLFHKDLVNSTCKSFK